MAAAQGEANEIGMDGVRAEGGGSESTHVVD